jgi:hypothetical protein
LEVAGKEKWGVIYIMTRELCGILCVRHPEIDPLNLIEQAVAAQVPLTEQADLQALLIEELRRLHEGVLARYGLRPAEYLIWKSAR